MGVGLGEDGAEVEKEGVVGGVADESGLSEAERFGELGDGLIFWDELEGDGGEFAPGHGAAAGAGEGVLDGDCGVFLRKSFNDLFGAGFEFLDFSAEEGEDGDVALLGIGLGFEVLVNRFLQGGEDEFVATNGPEEGLFFDLGDEVGTAPNDSGLWTAEELVAGEDDEIDTATEAFLGSGFVFDGREFFGVHHGSGAEVFDEWEAVVVGELGNFLNPGFADEALDVEVGAVDFEDQRGLGRDRFFVIGEVGLIGGTNFDELGTRGFEDIGNAESSTDLDELGAGNDDFIFPFGNEGSKSEDEGGGAVVDGGRGFGFEEAGEGGFEVAGSFSTSAGGEIEFEIGVAGRNFLESTGSAGSEGRASEIGMNQDAGGIDDGLEAGIGKFDESLAGRFFDVFA